MSPDVVFWREPSRIEGKTHDAGNSVTNRLRAHDLGVPSILLRVLSLCILANRLIVVNTEYPLLAAGQLGA